MLFNWKASHACETKEASIDRYTWSDSDVILSKIVTAAMLEVYYVEAM